MVPNMLIGQQAIDFTAKAVMPDNSIEEEFNLYSYTKDKKCILFFYPLDFTFVCPSEIIAFHNRLGEFFSRDTNVIGVSVDSHFSHFAWKSTSYNKGGIGNIQFPLVSDITKNISKSYGILVDEAVALRGTFFIDEDFVVRNMTVNDLPLGRNIEDSLRIIDAWTHFKNHGEVCPAGWKKGEQGLQATTEGVADYLSSNAEKL